MKHTPHPDEPIVIQKPTRLSLSCLWKMQRMYFDEEGIEAFVNQVPFYITSNPYIAHCYAEITLRFIRDCLHRNPHAKNHTFYILECGTGSGRFSFYVLKALETLKQELKMESVSTCYIMSDFTPKNIQYYETHPALVPYVDQGLLDFAILDLEATETITLLKKNIRLQNETLVNPLILFANYIFDTISHDAFTVRDGKLYELLLSVSTPSKNWQGDIPLDMEQLSLNYSLNDIQYPYYNDPLLDALLEEYSTALQNSSFLLPIGSIRALQYLRQLAHDRMIVIASDKGHSCLKTLDHVGYPALSFHGSFSLMVNFHALARYFTLSAGDSFLQTPRKGIKTCVFLSGDSLKELPETRVAIERYLEGISPADYFTLHRRMSDEFQTCNLDTIAAHLQLAGWDPHVYLKLANHIISLLPGADSESLQSMSNNMHKIAANYYYLPHSDCVLFEIAVFFHTLKQYDEALYYYHEAERYVGHQFGLFYNMGLCQYALGKDDEALENFEEATHFNPTSKEANDWYVFIKQRLAHQAQDKAFTIS